MPQLLAELAGRRLQAIPAGPVLVARSRTRLQAGARVGPADDALLWPPGHHHLDVAVGLGRAARHHVLEPGDVAVDVKAHQAGLGKVVLIGGAQRQRHRRQLGQLAGQRVGDDLGGFGARGLDAPREGAEREINLGSLGGRAVQQRQSLVGLRLHESVVLAPGQLTQRVGCRRRRRCHPTRRRRCRAPCRSDRRAP